MSNPIVSINLVVYNGEKYIRQSLDSVLKQSYPHENIELNILDNNSTDKTRELIKGFRFQVSGFSIPKFSLVESSENLGMWPGQEKLLENSHGKYIIALSVDVILHPDFVKNAIEAMEQDPQIGALQAKIFKFSLAELPTTPKESRRDPTGQANYQLPTTTIDTLGFKIYKSRRIVNIGHGEEDKSQYDQIQDTRYKIQNTKCEIFAVEGAVPIFRKGALESCRLASQANKIVDPDFFWYGDDLDLAWRMRLFGWKQVYAPSVIAWHDRKTTKSLAGGGLKEFIRIRKTVPMFKRRLDWRNTTLAIIKNDFAINILRDLPHILWRQLRLWAYFVIFEPAMIQEIFKVAKLLPRMLKRRKEIMAKAKISPKEFRQWIQGTAETQKNGKQEF